MSKYPIANKMVGILRRRKVRSVLMPREDFVAVVAKELRKPGYPEAIREDILATAETMPRFPFGTWINTDRGCGCVIGEYLIASAEVERSVLLKDVDDAWQTVQELLEDNPHKTELLAFGNEIDRVMRSATGTDHDVRSIEIVG